MWFELALASMLLCAGLIAFGRFEEGTPKWRRLLKIVIFLGLTAWIATGAGRPWALGWIAFAGTLGLSVHFIWCRRNGIDPWTAEPWGRYSELRGWKS
jgi:hypothetical protein